MSEQLYCVLDYETYSECDLKKAGAYEYSVHPSTEIICAAWRIGTRESLRTAKTEYWHPALGDENLTSLYAALLSSVFFMVAHNALFEQVITANVLFRANNFKKFNPERWICTASKASALALPRSLEGAAAALKLPVQKDMEGRRLILKWCKPRKATKNNLKSRHDDPAELRRLVEYCKQDVAAEVELFLKTPGLTETERKVWCLDQKINLRGFLVDRPLVTKVLALVKEETENVNKRTDELTFSGLSSATQRDGVLKFLESEGVFLPDLRRKTVEDAIKDGLVTGAAKEIIEHRLAISKTSTAKYQAFELRSRSDGRCRDNLLYHAASTGRWGGVGVQPQNLPRSQIKNTDQAAEILRTEDLEMIRLIYGDPMTVFSGCTRSAIIAPPGKILDVADYNAIEVRVLFWVADHKAGLKAFRDGKDLYVDQASKIYGIDVSKIDVDKRWLGKTAILGCGYAMGAKKFAITCQSQGREISEALGKAAVDSYRSTHAPVVQLWGCIERAAISAVGNLGTKFSINHTTWYVKDNFLWCVLPSGRRLAYYGPSVRYEPTPWGDKRPVLYHWGVDPLSKKWVESKTYGGKLVENVVQAVARDLMAEAMLRIEAAGPWDVVLSVHDELISERDVFSNGSNTEYCRLMAELPAWAEGCPVVATGWEGPRYKK